MIIDARQAGLSISDTTDLESLEFTQSSAKKKKKSSSIEGQFCGQKRLIGERGQRRMARLFGTVREATVTQITTL